MSENQSNNSVFREKSISRVSSPEELNDYIRVTTPSVWIVLIALVVIFKEQLTALVQNIFGSITGGVAVITE